MVSGLLLFVGVVVGYASLAGLLMAAQSPPRLCGGANRMRDFRSLRCRGPFSYDHAMCPDCNAYTYKAFRAWIWPISWIYLLPRAAFRYTSRLRLPEPPPPDAEVDAIERELNEELRRGEA